MNIFLIDNNLPPDLAVWFSAREIGAIHLRNLGMTRASDEAIWDYAQENRLVIITKDRDFDRFALQADASFTRVFRLNIGNATKKNLFEWLETRLPLFQDFQRVWSEPETFDTKRLVFVD